MKKIFLVTSLLVGQCALASANHCPVDMKKIDAAMKTTMVDETIKKRVLELYIKGKAEHEAGDHASSMKDFGEAMKLLDI